MLRHSRLIVLGILASVTLFGRIGLPASSWNQAQAQFLEKAGRTAGNVGVQVTELPSGRVFWSYRATDTMIPASLLKVATSYAALKTLGPTHRFRTAVWSEGPLRGDTLPSALWLRSEGDLFWTLERAMELALKLKELGIRSIRGPVLVDNGYFSPPCERICLDEACEDSYNPMVSGTALEFNSVAIRVLPSSTVGKPPRMEWFPPGRFIQLTNLAKTASRRSKNTLSVREIETDRSGMMRFQVSGKLPVSSGMGLERRYAVAEPSVFVAAAFTAALEQTGIQVEERPDGSMGRKAVPAGATMLAESISPTLAETVYGLNRHSNNFMAEMLLRSTGAVSMGQPGTELKGIVVMNKVLKDLGAAPGECTLKTGSGLSRECRMSPRTLSMVLVNAYSDRLAGPPFMESLAVNGQDGTLRKRLSQSSAVVRGKTGTLKDVVGFAGYVSTGPHTPCAVVIMLNEVHNLPGAKEAVDSFLENVALHVPFR
jgi:D-alanyl-D-alanine carboxypeptidase/D-alanyl-D-alanine-endopeptidase (penicillin-binding protein 4)